MQSLLKEKQEILSLEIGLETKWKFKEDFISKWLVNIYGIGIKMLAIREENRYNEESVAQWLMTKKSDLEYDFLQHCEKSVATEIILKNLCHDYLEPSIFDQVKCGFQNEFISDISLIKDMGAKYEFLFGIHAELADENTDASTIRRFSKDYKKFAEEWIKEKVINESIKKLWFEKKLQGFLDKKYQKIKEKSEAAANNCMEANNFSPQEWWTKLKAELTSDLVIQVGPLIFLF